MRMLQSAMSADWSAHALVDSHVGKMWTRAYTACIDH